VLLALTALLLVAVVLMVPAVWRALARGGRRLAKRRAERRGREVLDIPDPGRERRAEHRARELLRSCVDDEEWEMYRDLGFIRVWGTQAGGRRGASGESYAYLIYPHRPIAAYVPATRELLSEYCVEFPDLTGAGSRSRLPDSDDVLAKWMALTGDERRLIGDANMHLPGRQLDPGSVRRDIWRLAQWERGRSGSSRLTASE
jgi:hypothetical protein